MNEDECKSLADAADLLPINATPLERCLAKLMARVNTIPIEINKLWGINTCPVAFLTRLAWAVSVNDWDINWSDDELDPEQEMAARETIANSILLNSSKGTFGAVEHAAKSFDNTIVIQEWHHTNTTHTDPYQFELLVNDGSLSDEELIRLKQVIDQVKPERSRFFILSTSPVVEEVHTLTSADYIDLMVTKVSNVTIDNGSYSANTDYVENGTGIVIRIPSGAINIGATVQVSFDKEVNETITFSSGNNRITLTQTVSNLNRIESARTLEEYQPGPNADYTVDGLDIIRTAQSRIEEDEEVSIHYTTPVIDQSHTFGSNNAQGFFVNLSQTNVKNVVEITSNGETVNYDTLYVSAGAVTLIDPTLSSGDTVLISYAYV